jgi:hypothetical protein
LMLILAWYTSTHCAKASSTSWYMTGHRVLVFPFTVSSRANSSAERCRVLLIIACVTVTWWISSNQFTRALWLRAGLSLLYQRGQCAGTPSNGCGLVWGTSPLLVVGEEKNGSYRAFMHKQCNKIDLQVFVFTRQLSYCTYMGIQFEAEIGCSSIFQNVPWCSVPTDSCGSDRINQVLYRQEGSRTFRDFPRGFHDLLQRVAHICTVYI